MVSVIVDFEAFDNKMNEKPINFNIEKVVVLPQGHESWLLASTDSPASSA